MTVNTKKVTIVIMANVPWERKEKKNYLGFVFYLLLFILHLKSREKN